MFLFETAFPFITSNGDLAWRLQSRTRMARTRLRGGVAMPVLDSQTAHEVPLEVMKRKRSLKKEHANAAD